MVQPSIIDFSTFWASWNLLEKKMIKNRTISASASVQNRPKNWISENLVLGILNHLRCWHLESPKVNITLWRYKGL